MSHIAIASKECKECEDGTYLKTDSSSFLSLRQQTQEEEGLVGLLGEEDFEVAGQSLLELEFFLVESAFNAPFF